MTPAATVRVPEHVVSRAFEAETVVLNLRTGAYHGLNPTAALMFDLLREHRSITAVAGVVAAEFGRPVADVTGDIELFCADLARRDLVEITSAPDG